MILVGPFTRAKGTAVGHYNFVRFTGAAIGPLAGGIAMTLGIDAVILNATAFRVGAAWFVHRRLTTCTSKSASRLDSRRAVAAWLGQR